LKRHPGQWQVWAHVWAGQRIQPSAVPTAVIAVPERDAATVTLL
jgi:hypothetical protein